MARVSIVGERAPIFWAGCAAIFAGVFLTLLAEVMPPRHRSRVLVLVGGIGLVGGYLAASGARETRGRSLREIEAGTA